MAVSAGCLQETSTVAGSVRVPWLAIGEAGVHHHGDPSAALGAVLRARLPAMRTCNGADDGEPQPGRSSPVFRIAHGPGERLESLAEECLAEPRAGVLHHHGQRVTLKTGANLDLPA